MCEKIKFRTSICCCNQQRRRGRLVEVCDEAIRNLELIRRVDELICPTLVWLHNATRENTRFECTHNTATNGIDVLLGLERLVDHICRVLRDFEVLAVHTVLC